MENIEEVMTEMVCSYITDHIRLNLRVDVNLTEDEIKGITNIKMDKGVKEALKAVVKIIPDGITIHLRGKNDN